MLVEGYQRFFRGGFKDEEEIINLNVIAFQALLKHYLKIMVTNKSGELMFLP